MNKIINHPFITTTLLLTTLSCTVDLAYSLNNNQQRTPISANPLSSDNKGYYSTAPGLEAGYSVPHGCAVYDSVHHEFHCGVGADGKHVLHYGHGCYDPSEQITDFLSDAACISDLTQHTPQAMSLKVNPSFLAAHNAIPSNQWYSSLFWKMGYTQSQFTQDIQWEGDHPEDYSFPMFALPLAMQTDSQGLNIGYNPNPSVTETQFSYPYIAALSLGLQGSDGHAMQATNTVLENNSDWAVTALWRQNTNPLMSATMAHGSPYVYLKAHNHLNQAKITIKPQANANPIHYVYQISHLTGTFTNQTGAPVDFWMQGGTHNSKVDVGVITQVKITYQFSNDPKDVRVEKFSIIPTSGDNVFQEFTPSVTKSYGAAFKDMYHGSIRVEVWVSSHGINPNGYSILNNATSVINTPYSFHNMGDTDTTRFYLKPTQSQDSPYLGSLTTTSPGGTQPLDKSNKFAILQQSNNSILFYANNGYFAAFAGGAWSVKKNKDGSHTLIAPLTNNNVYSVAVMPDTISKPALQSSIFNTFAKDAFNAIDPADGTRATWSYNKDKGSLTTTYHFNTKNKGETLTALYPHQWDNLLGEKPTVIGTYQTVRGLLHLIEPKANTFQTKLAYHGILPVIPVTDSWTSAEIATLKSFIQDAYTTDITNTNIPQDTYWAGKYYMHLVQLIETSNQLYQYEWRHNNTEAANDALFKRNAFIKKLEDQLALWFSMKSPDGRYFYYDARWNTMIGFPSSFGSSHELNDHMFHFGYFIRAAATVARFDHSWAKQWGGMVNLLINDIASTQHSNSKATQNNSVNMPFLRSMDVYEGHAWASGHANFGDGNNEESSSEALNAYASMIMWGNVTNNASMTNLGVYLYSTEAESALMYHFDAKHEVNPKDFTKPMCGIIWGDSCVYSKWFAGGPEAIHGINFLPVTATSLYLGFYPNYMQYNVEQLEKEHNDPTAWGAWLASVAQAYALSNPQAGLNLWLTHGEGVDGVESKAHVYNFLNGLKHLGAVDTTASASAPEAAILGSTPVAYNASNNAISVHFNSGATLTVLAYSIGVSGESPAPFSPYTPNTDHPSVTVNEVSFDNSSNQLTTHWTTEQVQTQTNFDHFEISVSKQSSVLLTWRAEKTASEDTHSLNLQDGTYTVKVSALDKDGNLLDQESVNGQSVTIHHHTPPVGQSYDYKVTLGYGSNKLTGDGISCADATHCTISKKTVNSSFSFKGIKHSCTVKVIDNGDLQTIGACVGLVVYPIKSGDPANTRYMALGSEF